MDVQDTPRTSSAPEDRAGTPKTTPVDNADHPDQIPGGRYHIVDRLSTSAIGAVYKALDTILDRPVAVKCVRLDTPFADHGPDELRERFVREARVAAKLQHPNIVTIHDIVATPERGYIIMEFIECRTLESLLESEGRLPLSTAIRILGQLSSALDYAHSRNVVHRDVKPANILVSPSMYVWVTDFGIAKSELSTNLTMAGGVLGTPDYMSPEQAKGEDVDARSDLFSLGCILFECVVGEKPFRSPSLTGVLLSIINDEPVFPLNWRSLGLPMKLKPILHYALEKDREKRFPSGAELMEALDRISREAVAEADAAVRGEPEIDVAKEGADGESAPDEAQEVPPTEAKAESAPADSDVSTPIRPGETSDEPEGPDPVAAEPSPTDSRDTSTAEVAAPSPDNSESDDRDQAPMRADTAVAETADAEPADTTAAKAEASSPTETNKPAKQESAPETQVASAPSGSDETEVSSREDDTALSAEADPSGDGSAEPAIAPERIQELKEESRVLHLSPTLSADLQGVEISPEEGFLLSRIDGASRPNDIMSVSPMAEAETARALEALLDKGLIRLGGVTRETVTKAPEPPQPPPKPAGPDAATVSEVNRLLSLADSGDHPGLLGLSLDAPEVERKSAYLQIVAKYHPDKFSSAEAAFRNKLSRLCAAAAEAMTDFHKGTKSKPDPEPQARASDNGSPSASNGGDPGPFDKRRYARELYDRALTAFERADYWDAIQLGRQAIEADGQEAEFYGLLGRALLQNKKWRKEAADNFLKASQLEPDNVDYVGMLGAIYHHEGLTTRAQTLLDRARKIDPDYEFPDLDGTEVTTD